MTNSRRRFYASCRRAGALPGLRVKSNRRYRAEREVASNLAQPPLKELTWTRSGFRARSFLRIGLAVGAMLAFAVPAHADPIFTPIFVAATAAVEAAGTAVASISVASVLGSVTSTACGGGLTMLGERKCPR